MPRTATMSGTLGTRRSRSPLALAATLFASVALLLAVAAPAANAATATDSYGYLTTFGSGTAQNFGNPSYNAIAVDGSTGNILFAEANNIDVQIYSPDQAAGGVPLTVKTMPYINNQFIFPVDLAIDQSNGALYVFDDNRKGVIRFLTDGAPVPTYTHDLSFAPVGQFGTVTPGGLAVDSVTHDILVGNRDAFGNPDANRVDRFDATGALVSSLDGSNTAGGVFKSVGSLAVGPTGTVYVVDDSGRRVERFNAAGASLGALPISADGAPSKIAVNPQSGAVAVVVLRQGQTFIEGFTAGGQSTFSVHLPVQAGGAPTGLAWDGNSDRIYLDTDPGIIHTFVTAKQPGVNPPIISQITGFSAHLEAKVAPGGEGGEKAKARIEYCPATAKCADYLVSNPEDPSNPWVRLTEHEELQTELDGNGEVTIAEDLTGLAPNSSYLVRVSANRVAADHALTDNTSASVPLDTPLIPPDVQTGLAGAMTDTQAQLSGTIDTFGDQTTYHFEYGPTTDYGASAPAGAEGVAGNSRTPRTFFRTITGLQPATTYHYRLVAHNSADEASGEDRTFTTVATADLPPSRGFEMVTPVDKRGSTLRPIGFQAAADGSGIAYALASGASDSAGAPAVPRYFSRREASDWSDWQPLDPPLNVWRAPVGYATQAVSADFTHSFVVSNRALAPKAIETGANVYIQDLQTGDYTLVGSAKGLNAYLSFNGVLPPNNYLAGAPDFSWVIFASTPPLLPDVTGAALYKWTEAGGLEVESRLPGPKPGPLPNGDVSMLPKNVLTRRSASDDGNTMYFSLTGPNGGVYRRANGQTTPISVSEIPGDPATPVQGEFDGMSQDGRYAFFRSERLTPDAAVVPSQLLPADLYRYDSAAPEGGRLTYIGTVVTPELGRVIGNSDDGQTIYYNGDQEGTVVWRDGVSHTVTPKHPDAGGDGMEARPSDNGRFLAYTENGDVYLYDADADQNACASCRPDGSPGGTAALLLHDRDLANRAEQVVTDDGSVFFDTAVPLTPADHNGTRDVYSYRGGLLTLISPGEGNFDANFADATPDGSSIYFTTDEPLVSRDTNGELDLYVSRVGGGFPAQSPPAPPASCTKSECAEADSGPLISPAVGSSSSQSAGKPRKRCAKGTHARKVKGKTRCVKPSKAKKKAKRANTNRRQGR